MQKYYFLYVHVKFARTIILLLTCSFTLVVQFFAILIDLLNHIKLIIRKNFENLLKLLDYRNIK